ncbi:MAG: hypothetical protein JXR70_12035 [Spirochaetales bacterium]|nr:hypothetical protein [Spirochaetales bacterium]
MDLASFQFIIPVVCLALILVFRYMDRNNRSLDKVKRFSDKIKGELSDFVEARSTEIRNLAIDMQVNLKTGKEILKRINHVEEDLKDRSELLNNLQKRVSEYDSILTDLSSATGVVEENLRRIHEESKFIDSVNRKISDSQSRLLQLEKRIPQLHEEFNQLNLENLSAAKSGVLSDMGSLKEKARAEVNELEARVRDFGEYISRLEAKKDSMEQDTVKNLEGVYHGWEVKTSDMTGHFTHQLTQNMAVYKKEMGQIEVLYQKKIDQMAKDALEFEHKSFEELKGVIAQKSKKALQEVDLHLNKTRAHYEDKTKKIYDLFEGLKSKTESFETQIGQKMEKANEILQTRYKEKLAQINSYFEKTTSHNNESLGVLKSQIDEFIKESTGKLKTSDAEVNSKIKEISSRITEISKDSTAIYGQLSQKLEKDNHDFSQRMTKLSDEMFKGFEQKKNLLNKELLSLNDQFIKLQAKVKDNDAVMHEKISSTNQALENFTKQVKEKTVLIKEELQSKVLGNLDKELKHFEEDMLYRIGKIEEVNVDIEKMDQNIQELIEAKKDEQLRVFENFCKDLESRWLDEEKQYQANLVRIQGEINNVDKEVEDLKSKAYDNVSEKLQIFEDDFFADLKARNDKWQALLADWQSKAEKRLGELENNTQTEGQKAFNLFLEKLDSKMVQLKAETEHQFTGAQKNVESALARIEADITSSDEKVIAIKEDLVSKITQVKSQAMENLTKDIGIFQNKLHLLLDDNKKYWEKEMAEHQGLVEKGAQKLKNLYEKSQGEFSQAESELSEKLKNLLLDSNKRLLSHKDNVNAMIIKTDEVLRSEITRVGNELKAQSQVVEKESTQNLQKNKSDLDAALAKQQLLLEEGQAKADKLSKEIEGRFKNYDSELGLRLREALDKSSALVSSQKSEMEMLLADYEDTIRNELKVSEDSLNKNILELNQKYEKIVTKLDAKGTKLQEKFEALEGKGGELREKFTLLNQDVRALSKDIRDISKEALIEFKDEVGVVNSQLIDMRDKISGEVEDKLIQIKSDIETRETNLQKNIDRNFSLADDKYKRIMDNLVAIDKQQKNFTAQTKLFERADTLKIALQEDIEELKSTIIKINADKKRVETIEGELIKAQKLADDASVKFNRFMVEKRRIDALEKSFDQILKLSSSIENQLDSVTTAHDTLQQIKIKIKELEETEDKVSQKILRLEKKGSVIDSTIQSVDKNFKTLEDLEFQLNALKVNMEEYPPKLLSIGQQVNQLLDNKNKADKAIDLLERLDNTISDIEARTEKLQTAREWLSRTETRLETINKDAHDQLNLLRDLVDKNDLSAGAKNGAPSLDKRQMIIKLARQGWSVKEISKVTKTSVGEVELILELAPQKR